MRKLVTLIVIALAFLVPVLGWTPLWVLCILHIACAYRRTDSRGVHAFYWIMALICVAMIVVNGYMRIMDLHIQLPF